MLVTYRRQILKTVAILSDGRKYFYDHWRANFGDFEGHPRYFADLWNIESAEKRLSCIRAPGFRML